MEPKTKRERVSAVSTRPYKGFVYNVTTETGNVFVENVLVHNSGGLGTPAHLRVEPGLIHRANGGVLFLDEIATLSQRGQQELLTAMQEKKYSISGQSENSSGAMTRTDPVPCFPKGTLIETENRSVAIEELVDSLFAQGPDAGQFKKEGETEFLELSNHLRVRVPTQEGIVLDRLERVYRRSYSGKLKRLLFEDGTELVATPEHPIKTPFGFVKAAQLAVGDVVESAVCIIGEAAVIRTYNAENQRIAWAYLEWKKNLSASFSALGVDYKTIVGWKKGAVPRAIQCTNWLKEKGLLPLKITDSRLPLIARISGGLFGDGGLSRTGLYFTTDVESGEDLHSFKSDLFAIFGAETNSNFVVRRLVSKTGQGLELSMHNAFASRFLLSLGVPQGDKVSQAFTVPQWVYLSPVLKKEFFSALLSCEMCGKIRNATDKISFVMAKVKQFEDAHRAFLNEIQGFLTGYTVATTETAEKRTYLKKTKNGHVPAALFSFDILNNHQNVRNLQRAITIVYADRKALFMDKRFAGAKAHADYLRVLSESKVGAQALRKNGLTLRKIAQKAHLSVNTVMKVVGPTYNHYSKEDKEKARALARTSGALKDLARQLNIPYTTLLYWKKRGFSNE